LVISNRDLIPGLSVAYAELDSAVRNKLAKQTAFHGDDPATLLMTSGSSASSKIVQHSHKNHISSALGSNLNIPLSQKDRWLLTLPLYHVGSLSILYRTTLAGAAVVIPNSHDSILKSISDLQISHVSLVATQFQRILEDSTAIHPLRKMKAILLGGSAIPKDLIQTALAHELPVYVSYGSTEMASQVCTTTSSHRAEALTSSGTLLANRDLVISHEGEILVKGDTLAQGYLDGNDLINLRDKEGWFHTGDVGYVDPQGALTVTGRMDNQFVSGGENIQPEHIENILNKIPDIAQAIVLPQSDDEFGKRPVAFLQLINTNISLEELEKNLRKSLPGYMIPIAFYRLPEHLTTDLIKISRHEISKYVLDPNNHLHPLE
jgi:O-succinylbenzoic acid--CoA ligase